MDAKWFRWPLIGLMGLMSWSLHAAEVVFLTPEKLPSVEQLATALAQQQGIKTRVELSANAHLLVPDQTLAVVLMGAASMQAWQPSSIPAIGLSTRVMMFPHRHKLVSGLYIDPPLPRQVLLTKLLLGKDSTVGILVGKRNNWQRFGLAPAFMKEQNVVLYFTDEFESLNRGFQTIYRDQDALIGVMDAELYSPANIKSILITAYRQGRPLIGPSQAYLRAGALATTYSSLEDNARRLSEILQAGLEQGSWPAIGDNPYYRVGINSQVGRSLKLSLPKEDELAERVREAEKRL